MARKASRKPLQLALESLERREMMTTASFAGGVLTLAGTTGNDTIAVRQVGSSLKVDGFSGSVPLSQIKRIDIATGRGNDTVTLQIDAAAAAKVYADLGTGYDTLNTPRGAPVALKQGTEFSGTGPAPASTSTTSPPPSSSGSGSSTRTPSGLSPGYYFETKSGIVGASNERFGPFATKPEAEAALKSRLDMIGSAGLTQPIYHVGSTSGSGTPGNGTGAGTTTPPTPSPYLQDAIDWIASKWKYKNWGGMSNAPAEKLGISFRGLPQNQLEQLAEKLIKRHYIPAYADVVDKAFMMHDLRLKWVRDTYNDSSLGYSSKHPEILRIHRQLINDLAPYNFPFSPYSVTAANRAATQASLAFKLLLSWTSN
jgi:hypothetical protein